MAELKEVKAQINTYLNTPYLGYRDNGSIRHHTLKGIRLYVAGITAGAGIYSPEVASQLPTVLKKTLEHHPSLALGKSQVEEYKLDKGEIVWEIPIGSPYRSKTQVEKFDGPIAQLGYVNPALPRYELARQLDTVSSAEKIRSKAKKDKHGIYAVYNYRYRFFCFESGLGGTHPYPKYVALLFVEDIAKKNSLRAIRTELFNLQPGNPSAIVAPPTESVEQAVGYVTRKLKNPLYHLGYLMLIGAVRRQFVKRYGLDEDKRNILGDIAFFRKGKLEMGDLTKLLSPIMQAVGSERFDEARVYLDFLGSNFKGNFPKWRRELIHGVRYPTVRAMVLDKYYDEETISEVPELYQPLIQAEIDQINSRANRLSEIEAVKKEKTRRETLASRLLYESIVETSIAQSKEQNEMDFNPDLPPSYNNPLIINYKPVISDLDKMGHQKNWVYIGEKNDGKKSSVLVTEYGSWHSITTIFSSLLYQNLMTKEFVEKAFEKLKESGIVFETDTLADILRLGLSPSVRNYEERMTHLDVDDDGKKLIHQKLALIDDFVDGFEAKSDDNNYSLSDY